MYIPVKTKDSIYYAKMDAAKRIFKENKQSDRCKELDIDVCRLCMSKDAKIQIFPEKSESKDIKVLPLVCKIMSSVNIQVRKDDGLPTHICSDCASKVEETYEFLRLCEISDSFLRQYLDFGLHVSFSFRYSDYLRTLEHSEEEDDEEHNEL